MEVLGNVDPRQCSGGSQAPVFSSSGCLTSRIPRAISRWAGGLPSLSGSLRKELLRGKLTKYTKSTDSVATRAPVVIQARISSLWKVGR